MDTMTKLQGNIDSFQEYWKGGYYEGNPMDPLGRSTYGELGYISSLHAVYCACIKPYINENTVTCEIGCGRGAWTKTLLPSKEVWCLDVVPPEHNGFWDYVGRHSHVQYRRVSDFSCSSLPDDYFTFLFSFGCLCHVPFEGITQYMTNMHQKLKKGSHGFILVGDYDKYNGALNDLRKYSVNIRATPRRLRWLVQSYVLAHEWLWPTGRRQKTESDAPEPGRWYHAGVDATCEMLNRIGYTVVDRDVGLNVRDPIVHFIKP